MTIPYKQVRLRYRPDTGVPRPVVTFCADAGPSFHIAYFVCEADMEKATTACITFNEVREFRWLSAVDQQALLRELGISGGGLVRHKEGKYSRYLAAFHNELFEIFAVRHRCARGSGSLTRDAASFLASAKCEIEGDEPESSLSAF